MVKRNALKADPERRELLNTDQNNALRVGGVLYSK